MSPSRPICALSQVELPPVSRRPGSGRWSQVGSSDTLTRLCLGLCALQGDWSKGLCMSQTHVGGGRRGPPLTISAEGVRTHSQDAPWPLHLRVPVHALDVSMELYLGGRLTRGRLGGPESWRQAHGPPEPLPSLDRQTPSLRLTYVPSCPLHRGHAHKGFWECAGITNKATAAA